MIANLFKSTRPFLTESGKKIPELEIAYHTYGTLNEEKNNVVWVCHALTANSDVVDWWKGLFGEDELFNPREHFIVCANILASCYGSTGPLHTDIDTGSPYYQYFPQITVRDMVAAHRLLAEYLEIDIINTLIGGSLGGQQALEWSVQEPDRIHNLVLAATNAQHSPWGIAFNESQRLAIKADRTWYSQSPDGGKKGLKAARSIALLSYRHYQTYQATQSDEDTEKTDHYKASSYQDYQGEKLIARFNAYSYYFLTKAMDSHNIGRGRGGVIPALKTVKARTLVIGITTDILFPRKEQVFLANHIPGARFSEIESVYGHDGFLIETWQLSRVIGEFLGKPGTAAVKEREISETAPSAAL